MKKWQNCEQNKIIPRQNCLIYIFIYCEPLQKIKLKNIIIIMLKNECNKPYKQPKKVVSHLRHVFGWDWASLFTFQINILDSFEKNTHFCICWMTKGSCLIITAGASPWHSQDCTKSDKNSILPCLTAGPEMRSSLNPSLQWDFSAYLYSLAYFTVFSHQKIRSDLVRFFFLSILNLRHSCFHNASTSLFWKLKFTTLYILNLV